MQILEPVSKFAAADVENTNSRPEQHEANERSSARE